MKFGMKWLSLGLILLLTSCGIWKHTESIDPHDARYAPKAMKYKGPVIPRLPKDIKMDTVSFSANSSAALAPYDPHITKGALGNGVSYYIRSNTSEPGSISLKWVLGVGAIHEPNSYPGTMHILAHLAEHYFNSRTLGRGAHTSIEVTYSSFRVSMILDTSKQSITPVLDLLSQFTESLDLSASALDRAKRAALSCTSHVYSSYTDEIAKILFSASKYASHLPYYGDSSLLSIPDDSLRFFFHQWFKPEHSAIILVGDIDSKRMKHHITQTFGANPSESKYKRVPVFKAPLHRKLYVGILPGGEERWIYWVQHRPHASQHTRKTLLKVMPRRILPVLWSNRVKKRFPADSLLYNGFSDGDEGVDAWSMKWSVPEDKSALALVKEIREMGAQISKEGFTDSEIAEAKRQLLQSLHRPGRRTNESYVDSYARNFLYSYPIPSLEQESEMLEAVLSSLSSADIHKLFRQWFSKRNRTVILMGKRHQLPTEREVRSVLPK